MVLDHTQRAFALVGPGRAGTTLAVAMVARGWTPIAVAGRAPDSPSVLRVAALLDAPARDIAARRRRRRRRADRHSRRRDRRGRVRVAPSLRAGALVVHLSGACTLDELHKLRVARPDVELGSLHPLQSLPSSEIGVARLPGLVVRGRRPRRRRAARDLVGHAPVPRERRRPGHVSRGRHRRVEPSRRAARAGGPARRRRGGAAGRAASRSCARRSRTSRHSVPKLRSPARWRAATSTPCGVTSTRCPTTSSLRTARSRSRRVDSRAGTIPALRHALEGDA